MKKKLPTTILVAMLLIITTFATATTAMTLNTPRGTINHTGRGDIAIAYMSYDESQQHENGIYTFDTGNPHEITALSAWQPGDYGYCTGGTYDLDGNLYMVDGSDTSSILYLIDQTTWEGTAIGGTGYPMHAMTCDPTTDILYCAGGSPYESANLYTVDPSTGTATLVGSFSTGLNGVFDIAVDSTGQMYAVDVYTDSLYTVDKATGAATLVGPTGQNMNFEQDMCWDANLQTLYAVAYIFGQNSVFCSVNTATGSVTVLGIFGFPQLDALCFPLAVHHDDLPPQTSITLSGQGGPDVFTSDVTVTLTAVDNDSGVNRTMYKLDSAAWTIYDGPFVVTADGNHTVSYYSFDNAGNQETEQSKVFSIEHPMTLTITIQGGLGVSAVIKNTGTRNLTNLDWSFVLDGKLIFVGKSKSGTIPTLAAGEETTMKDFVIGFGTTGIVITAGDATATATGTVLVFFVMGVH